MLKIPENKTRKKLRITLCVLYLVEIVLCALPYFQYIDEKNVLHSYSVFDIMSVWGLSGSNDAVFKYSLFMPIFFIIPIAGFFFCALDKERNMKNIVSIICCLIGVLSIITMVSYTISLASVIALLLYILSSLSEMIAVFIFADFIFKIPSEQCVPENYRGLTAYPYQLSLILRRVCRKLRLFCPYMPP